MPQPVAPTVSALAAVDIGNTRLKVGLFEASEVPPAAGVLPVPTKVLDAAPDRLDLIADWLAPLHPHEAAWRVGSVQRDFTTELLELLRDHNATSRVALLSSRDLPLAIELPHPDRVGIDRLLGAVAANHVRPPSRPAVVVDVGTAITVDLVSADGAFQGGAILPGIGMSARAFHQFTDLLPLIEMCELAAPPSPLGADTIAAMKSGLYWGAVGGVRELIARLPADDPQVYLTGGAAPLVAPLLSPDARYEPHLVLAGIALASLEFRL